MPMLSILGLVAFGAERVEAVFQVLEEGLGVRIALGSAKRMSLQSSVGHDQLRHDLAVALRTCIQKGRSSP